jgi:hypothetical protein
MGNCSLRDSPDETRDRLGLRQREGSGGGARVGFTGGRPVALTTGDKSGRQWPEA